MLNIVIFGAPGSGKGTQSENLIKHYELFHISTGDVLRDHIKRGTELGKTAKQYIDQGQLIPDELMIGILAQVIDDNKEAAQNGVIFDGFPRTIPQAEALDEMGIGIDKVIDIEVADDVIVNRLSGRRVCEKCGRPYHTESLKPKVEGVCDDCAGALIQRKDDHPDTVKARLEIYHKETEPLKGYYEKQGKLYIVEGASSVEETTRLTFEALEA